MGANVAKDNLPLRYVLLQSLKHVCEISLKLHAVSRWYRTAAYPSGSGPDFLNGVACLKTQLNAVQVLEHLHAVEQKMGRKRDGRWGPRVIDLDLLDAGGQVLPDLPTYENWRDLPPTRQISDAPDTLILPHPRLHERSFVLFPLRDVAPDWIHPVSGKSVSELINELPAAQRNEIAVVDDEE